MRKLLEQRPIRGYVAKGHERVSGDGKVLWYTARALRMSSRKTGIEQERLTEQGAEKCGPSYLGRKWSNPKITRCDALLSSSAQAEPFVNIVPGYTHGRIPLRIAMVAPLVEAVPPERYGGTERVVSALTEELVGRGHDVTLFAAGDSRTSAHLVSCTPGSLRKNGDELLPGAAVMLQLSQIYANSAEFDIIHNHIDWQAFPFAQLSDTPTVSTMHGRLDLPEIRNTYARFPEQQLVSISMAQREYLPDANWLATVYNAIDVGRYHFREMRGDYLAFLGRISPQKRPDRAIEIAGRAGLRLVMAAKVDAADRDYYVSEIAPLIRRSPWVEFVGEVGDAEKDAILGHAYAYLFPIDWPEPFGLTMLEAMATGTPVVAWRCGSVPEVVQHGVTGFICDDIAGMVEAVGAVQGLRRADCRAHVERYFSVRLMTDRYEKAYRTLLSCGCGTVSLPPSPVPEYRAHHHDDGRAWRETIVRNI